MTKVLTIKVRMPEGAYDARVVERAARRDRLALRAVERAAARAAWARRRLVLEAAEADYVTSPLAAADLSLLDWLGVDLGALT